MTKIAIISDVHANSDALKLVLSDIEKRGVDKIVCLGDIVTKYYYPKDSVDMIRENSDIVVKGNCDDHVATNENYRWARGQLGMDRIEYLNNLPVKQQLMLGKVLVNFYHSNPRELEWMFNPLFKDNDKTSYKDKTIKNYNEMFPTTDPQTSIVGHTHMAYIGKEKEGVLQVTDYNDQEKKIILPTDRAIINVGSAGEANSLKILDNGKLDSSILPYLTYLIIDDANLRNGFNAQIIKVPYKETLKKVFMDSIANQKAGLFPYSPNDTRRIGTNIIRQDPDNEELRNQVEDSIEELNRIKRK